MDGWQKEHVAIAPIGTLVFAYLWWNATGPHVMADLAGFVEIGFATYASLVAIVESTGGIVFYAIAKFKQQQRAEREERERAEEERRRKELLEVLRDATERGETVQSLLARLENGQ